MVPISKLSTDTLKMYQNTGGSVNYSNSLITREIKRRLERKKRGTALDRLYRVVPDLRCDRGVVDWTRALPDTIDATLALRLAPNYYQAFRNSVLRVVAALAANRPVCRRPNFATFPYIQYWIAVRQCYSDAAEGTGVADEALRRLLDTLDQRRAKKRPT